MWIERGKWERVASACVCSNTAFVRAYVGIHKREK